MRKQSPGNLGARRLTRRELNRIVGLGLVGFCAHSCVGGKPPRSDGGKPPRSEQPQTPTRQGLPSPLRVVTYNVLADRTRASERMPALFRVLEGAFADILALQEVTDWITRLLLDNPWAAAYHVSTIDGRKGPDRGGQLILSRHPITRSRSLQLSGRQQRTALVSTIDLAGTPMHVATCHLESYLEDGPVRARQLDEIFAALALPGEAMLLGDLNFGDGEPEQGRLQSAFADIWQHVHGDDPGYTWDIERSEMARVSSFPGEPSRRIDRILVRSNHYRGHAIEIIGNTPVHPDRRDLFPSDHFGLLAELRTTTARRTAVLGKTSS